MISKLSRRRFLQISAATVAVGAAALAVPAQARPMLEQAVRKLKIRNANTNEVISITYWQHGDFDQEALRQLNHLLRDHNNGAATNMDPNLFNMLHRLQGRLQNFSTIDAISAYRSPETNRKLASHQRGVAKHSYHMAGKAVDIRIPGVDVSHIHNAALSLKSGGVGYYANADFVHLDTGPVRAW